MATPMTPDQRLAAYRAEGLTVVEIPGWRTNDRAPITGRPAGPKHGLVNHHTGGDTSNPYSYAAGILSKGSSALVGPLCHDGLDPDKGVLYTVGTGRTNHAGGGDPAVLNAVIADSVPFDRELKPTKGNTDGVDGNGPFYGLEVMYSGSRVPPRVGYVAMVKWNAAICRFHGWTAHSVIGHREWSDDKPDPGRVDMAALRRDVQAALDLPAGVWPGTGTGNQNPPPQEDDIVATLDDLNASNAHQTDDIVRRVLDTLRSEGISGAADPAYNGNAKVMQVLGQLPDDIAAEIKVPMPDPAAIAAAIPADIAQQVAEELASRLGRPAETSRALSVQDAAPADYVAVDGPQDAPACADASDPHNA